MADSSANKSENDGEPIKVNTTNKSEATIKSDINSSAEATSKSANPGSEPSNQSAQRVELDENPQDAPESSLKDKVISHQAKKLEPINAQPSAGADNQDAEDAQASDATKTTDEGEQAEASQKLDAMESELKSQAEIKKQAVEAQQQPKIYDTKKYHLPIKPTHHHKAQTVPPIVSILVVGVILLIFTYIAIDMEIVDLGIQVPIDFF